MREIELGRGLVARVDDQDFNRVSRFAWHVRNRPTNRYAATETRCVDGRRRHFFMHRLIMGFPAVGIGVDHVNGDGLDNQRENLRFATQRQNLQNRHRTYGSSKFKGVYFRRDTKKWSAYITVAGKREWLGCFEHEADAAKTYNRRAKDSFGEWAKTNAI